MTTYKEVGVDIEKADASLSRIGALAKSTQTPGALGKIGAFGGFFEVPKGFENPVLVSSVDGVGTKLKVAFATNKHDTIGEDLVNHCINDIAVCGAKPLFFMDYFATGALESGVLESVITGISRGCRINGCALIGGETAEMPDFYGPGEYDLAGTVVGIVEKSSILDGSQVSEGDVLVGLPSTGLHTNGYTLARYACFGTERAYEVDDYPEGLDGESVGDALLQVHRSYLSPIQMLCSRNLASAFAHVTGGGIEGNSSRVIPPPLIPSVDYNAWKRPPIFNFIQEQAEVPESDMRTTFNLGMGLVAIIQPQRLDKTLQLLTSEGESPVVIGQVMNRHN